MENKDRKGIAIIFMGKEAWSQSASFHPILPYTLCLPPKTNPFDFKWPLEKCEVYLVDTGSSARSFITYCVKAFFAYGATRVRYINKWRKLTFASTKSTGDVSTNTNQKEHYVSVNTEPKVLTEIITRSHPYE